MELVVEGPPAEVHLLLTQVRLEMERYIAAVEEQTRPGLGQFKTFDVRF